MAPGQAALIERNMRLKRELASVRQQCTTLDDDVIRLEEELRVLNLRKTIVFDPNRRGVTAGTTDPLITTTLPPLSRPGSHESMNRPLSARSFVQAQINTNLEHDQEKWARGSTLGLAGVHLNIQSRQGVRGGVQYYT
jgi:hypothetical protein